jgi:GntR family transcriptional regulator, carbon starvation induced regulator
VIEFKEKLRPSSGSLTAEAYARIRSEILCCRLAPGQKLVIQDICDTMDFSLGAVREALSRLTAEGLVEAQPRKGFRVAPVTEAELGDITMVRTRIEASCLESAIRNGDLQWESNIVALLFELSKLKLADPNDPKRLNSAWAETHQRFHQALVAACDSPWLLRLRETLFAHSERYRWMSHPLDRKKRNIHAEHEAIASAAVARDTHKACGLLGQHIAKTTQIIVESGTATPGIQS